MLKKILSTSLIIVSLQITTVFATNNYTFESMGQQIEKTVKADDIFTKTSNVNVKAMNFETQIDLSSIYKKYINMEPDVLHAKRGIVEAGIYEKASPSVVLILTKEASGSGTIITNQGDIITNWHVVAGYENVAVLFKPKGNNKVTKNDIFKAKVIKFDEVKDLAMLRLVAPPKKMTSLSLGKRSEIKVGHDVHAIGHPNGENWTYTKGFISQLRNDYVWKTDMGISHKANVIQTQTPINPGNSGGPLLDNSGKIIGVNSFKAEGEAMNFAVEIDDLHAFVSSKENVLAKKFETECNPEPISSARTKKNDGDLIYYDLDCNGTAESLLRSPDDKKESTILLIDSTGDGKYDEAYTDEGSDGKWDYSFHDTTGDGKPNLVGQHPDGSIEPSRYSEYSE